MIDVANVGTDQPTFFPTLYYKSIPVHFSEVVLILNRQIPESKVSFLNSQFNEYEKTCLNI